MRVYVATTPARVEGLREHGLPVGTEAYAATPALAEALGMPAPGDPGTDDDLVEVAVATAAEASLLLLAEDAEVPRPGTPAPRRVVLAADARARPVDGAEHPATVVLTAPLRYSSVDTVLADDPDSPALVARVARAVAAVGDDHERGVRMLEDTALGWFDPSELV